MKKILFLTSMALVAAVSFSCNKENIEGNGNAAGEEVVLYAPQSVIKASSVETKTALSGLEILWEEGDVISLFNENGTHMNYSLISGENTTSGEFRAESEPETGYSYAIYPAVSGQVAGTSVSVTVAQNQTYLAEGFSTEFPMGARTGDGLNFTFSNLATVLSLPLQGDAVVRSISIEAVGCEGLAGAATVDFSGATPVLAAGNSATVTLDCGEEGVQLSADAATVFNFILIPGEYSGLKVSVTDVNGHVTERSTGDLTLVAGSVKNFGSALDVNSTPQWWCLVGSFTNNWASWIDMHGDNGLSYCLDVEIPESNTFKIRINNEYWGGNGTINIDAPTLLASPGSDMSVAAGTYDIYWDQYAHYMFIMNSGNTPFSVSGDFNSWGDTQMEIVDGRMVARNIEFTAGTGFKIKSTGSWGDYDLGFGAQNIDIIPNTELSVQHKGHNMFIPGEDGTTVTYDIWFQLNGMKLWVMTPGVEPAFE